MNKIFLLSITFVLLFAGCTSGDRTGDVDTDGDGLYDKDEAEWGTDKNNPDSDGDGLLDGEEVHGYKATDGNTYTSHPLDKDTDDDGLEDGVEVGKVDGSDYITDPDNPDTDGDTLKDGEEVNGYKASDGKTYPSDPLDKDTDDDDLDDNIEVKDDNDSVTDPKNSDTDGDTLTDGQEVNGYPASDGNTYPSDPLDKDTDDDDLDDNVEVKDDNDSVTDPKNSDTDGDALEDGDEVNGLVYVLPAGEKTIVTDPLNKDTDGDNLEDGVEYNFPDSVPGVPGETDPTKKDTDEDGVNDDVEVGGDLSKPNNSSDEDDPDRHDALDPDYFGADEDRDGDGLTNEEEENGYLSPDGKTYTSNPDIADTDGDGLLDGVEVGEEDIDTDKNPNYLESDKITDPTNPDSDGDNLKDGEEVGMPDDPTDPNKKDTDDDGVDDDVEVGNPPLPNDKDKGKACTETDNTGSATNPANNNTADDPDVHDAQDPTNDSDCDGFPNDLETNVKKTDPLDPDSGDITKEPEGKALLDKGFVYIPGGVVLEQDEDGNDILENGFWMLKYEARGSGDFFTKETPTDIQTFIADHFDLYNPTDTRYNEAICKDCSTNTYLKVPRTVRGKETILFGTDVATVDKLMEDNDANKIVELTAIDAAFIVDESSPVEYEFVNDEGDTVDGTPVVLSFPTDRQWMHLNRVIMLSNDKTAWHNNKLVVKKEVEDEDGNKFTLMDNNVPDDYQTEIAEIAGSNREFTNGMIDALALERFLSAPSDAKAFADTTDMPSWMKPSRGYGKTVEGIDDVGGYDFLTLDGKTIQNIEIDDNGSKDDEDFAVNIRGGVGEKGDVPKNTGISWLSHDKGIGFTADYIGFRATTGYYDILTGDSGADPNQPAP